MSIHLRPLLLTAVLLLPAIGRAADEDLDLLEERAFQAAVERIAPSVVRIDTVGGLERVGDVLFGTGPTTGLVATADGYILSSAFNFLNEPAEILVQPAGQGRKPAKLVSTDHNRMLVLLKIEPDSPLAVPEIAPPEEIRVGQWAIAVGRAFEGDRPNVAVGIVSATRRVWGKAIQTDAAVSPNNYGGPLIDLRGRVLGILAPLSPEATEPIAGVEWYDSGIGFAVAAADVFDLLPRMQNEKDLRLGLAGLRYAAGDLYTGEPNIAGVHPRSPADRAGLKAGDRIVAIAGRPIDRAADVKQALSRLYAGDRVQIAVTRGAERVEKEIELVAELPRYVFPFLGILPMRGTGTPKSGVAIRYVYPEGPAAQAGLQPDDVITMAAGQAVADAPALQTILENHEPGEKIKLALRRAGSSMELEAALAALPAEPPPAPPPAAYGEPIPGAAAADEAARTGVVTLKTPDAAGDAWAYVPENYDAREPHGLIIWLEAGMKREALVARWKADCQRDRLIVVVPQPLSDGRWQPADLEQIRALKATVENRYRIDAARTVIGGQLEGGTLACVVALREHARGAIVIEAPLAGRFSAPEPGARLDLFVARSSSATNKHEDIAKLRELKYPVTLHDLGPAARDLTPDEQAQLARWIDTLDRL